MLRLQLEVVVVVWFHPIGLVWNDDVCITRARSAHQLDSDILVSAKLQLYRSTTELQRPLRVRRFDSLPEGLGVSFFAVGPSLGLIMYILNDTQISLT